MWIMNIISVKLSNIYKNRIVTNWNSKIFKNLNLRFFNIITYYNLLLNNIFSSIIRIKIII